MRDARRVLEEIDASERLDVVSQPSIDQAHPPSSLRWVLGVAAVVLAGTLLLSSNDPERSNVTTSVPVGRAVTIGGLNLRLTRVEPSRESLRLEFASRTPDPKALTDVDVEIGMAHVLTPIREAARPKPNRGGFSVTIPFGVTDGRIMRVTVTDLRYRLPGTITRPVDLSDVWPRPKAAPPVTIAIGDDATIAGVTFHVDGMVGEDDALWLNLRYTPSGHVAYFDSATLQAPPNAYRPSGTFAGSTGMTIRWERLPRDLRWTTLILSDAVLEYDDRWTWLADDS